MIKYGSRETQSRKPFEVLLLPANRISRGNGPAPINMQYTVIKPYMYCKTDLKQQEATQNSQPFKCMSVFQNAYQNI